MALQKQLNTLQSEQLVIEARYNAAKATGKIEAMSSEMDATNDSKSRLQKADSIVAAMEARNEAVADVTQAIDLESNSDNDDEQDIELEMQKLRNQLAG